MQSLTRMLEEMLDGSAIKNKKIQEINIKLKNKPLYQELFTILNINVQEDFMQAEILLDQVVIGTNYVKINEPTVELLDFFKSRHFTLHSILPAFESETYHNPIVAWLIKKE